MLVVRSWYKGSSYDVKLVVISWLSQFPDEPETRDAWWTELRTEIRSHARAMGCHAVIGYEEQTTICDEVIVLSASGQDTLSKFIF